jgi:hypothetical protein
MGADTLLVGRVRRRVVRLNSLLHFSCWDLESYAGESRNLDQGRVSDRVWNLYGTPMYRLEVFVHRCMEYIITSISESVLPCLIFNIGHGELNATQKKRGRHHMVDIMHWLQIKGRG